MTRKNRKSSRPGKPHRPVSIQRPGRYIGCEWNLPPIKTGSGIRVVLCYPDVYEIGMSHFGLQLLYQVFKSIPGVIVERVFAPWPDKEKAIRANGEFLTTLESGRPLKDCDLVCFTIPHELCFTNILNVLDLGGIPLLREERTGSAPIILGGGIAALNPLPLESFFDAFFMGEVEDRAEDIIRSFQATSRPEILGMLDQIPGIYIPDHAFLTDKNRTIKKQYILDLENAPHPDPPLVPYTRPVHERVVVEATRGCPKSCRFCQARVYYHPMRHRSPERITELINRNLAQTGYEEVTLLSLNIADYPGIELLLTNLMSCLTEKSVSISLPSLRPERLTPAMISEIQQVRKTGFTLAPEAGSERLRKIIGKPFPMNKLLDTVSAVFQAGWDVLKLYFMIGLPYEDDQDIQEMIDLIRRIAKISRSISGNRAAIHVSASTFIPKPHTAFQWCGQASEQDLRRRQQMIRNGCNSPNIKLSLDNVMTSRLEACLTRGDRRYGPVIADAFRSGCRFEAWNEHFNGSAWIRALEANGLSLEEEATRRYTPSPGNLPWSFIDSGVPEQQLADSFRAALETNQDSAFGESSSLLSQPHTIPVQVPVTSGPANEPRPMAKEKRHAVPGSVENTKYLGVFQVLDDYRLFGHMEIFNAVARAMRRADLPLAYSKGFNPHPKMSWMQPVPLGFERWCEPIEFHFSSKVAEPDVLTALNAQLPPELRFRSVSTHADDHLFKALNRYLIAINTSGNPQKAYENFGNNDKLSLIEPGSLMPDIRDRLEQLGMDFVCALSSPNPDGPGLKDVIRLFFGDQEPPLQPVTGARLGWITGKTDNWIPFGWKNQE